MALKDKLLADLMNLPEDERWMMMINKMYDIHLKVEELNRSLATKEVNQKRMKTR